MAGALGKNYYICYIGADYNKNHLNQVQKHAHLSQNFCSKISWSCAVSKVNKRRVSLPVQLLSRPRNTCISIKKLTFVLWKYRRIERHWINRLEEIIFCIEEYNPVCKHVALDFLCSAQYILTKVSPSLILNLRTRLCMNARIVSYE